MINKYYFNLECTSCAEQGHDVGRLIFTQWRPIEMVFVFQHRDVLLKLGGMIRPFNFKFPKQHERLRSTDYPGAMNIRLQADVYTNSF